MANAEIHQIVDQPARNEIADVRSMIRQHMAVCEERGKAEDAFRDRTEKFLERFQKIYERQVADLRLANETLGEKLKGALDDHGRQDIVAFAAAAAATNEAVKPLYNRFWGLAISLIGGLLLVCGFLAAKLLHLM